MSFQPEERYWTDYLRIALPVLGLLILIALLWYWATALIGGGSDTEPTPTVAPIVEVEPTVAPPASPIPSPSPTAPAIEPTVGVPPTVAATVPASTNPTVPPAGEPTAASGTDSGGNTLPECQNTPTYTVGNTVVTTSDVNLRPDASSTNEAVALLAAGTTLQITGEFVDQPDCDWWPVSDPATGQTGFVREDFLGPST